MVYIAMIPVSYLLITGAEYLFWPVRFSLIKKDVSLNFFLLCIASAVTMIGFWLWDHVVICWR
jgi:hypothetical protein